jgi:hypothetical protein
MTTFTQTVNEIIAEILQYGFDSQERIRRLTLKLKNAYIASILPEYKLQEMVRKQLTMTFDKLVKQKNLVNPEVQGFTIQRIKPHLRKELDKRIMASADLIKWRREESISNILRQFQGWSTSIPEGGAKSEGARDGANKLKKMTQTERYNQRRISIDQTAKLTSSIRDIVATDTGAIGAFWHSKGEHEKEYDYRKTRLKRSKLTGGFYLIRGSWADQQGLVKGVRSGIKEMYGDGEGVNYTDEMSQPAEEVFCRCNYQYVFSLRKVPEEFLTEKGKNLLQSKKTTN